jgi:flagellar basal-body rod protein FlgC
MDLTKSLQISAAGMKAQGTRLRVISENIANADSTAPTAGADPYRRKTVNFRNVFDRTVGTQTVKVDRVRPDNSDFEQRYMPGNPAADEKGYVKVPNVNPLIELMDMREAQRSYQANLNVIDTAKGMIQRTIDLLRA